MGFINFVRLISPDGGTWENYSRRKWGVGVDRYHGWLDGKHEKAWSRVLSLPDATLRWRGLQNKGWRETTRRNPKVMLRAAAKVPAHLLVRGTRVEREHTRSKRAARIIASHHIAEDPQYYAKLAVMENPVLSYAAAHRWESLAKSKGVSAVARSGRGFMRAYEKAGTWARLDPWWKARRNAFIARHMAQVRQNGEKMWKPDRSGKLQPSRRCLALLMWAYKPG